MNRANRCLIDSTGKQRTEFENISTGCDDERRAQSNWKAFSIDDIIVWTNSTLIYCSNKGAEQSSELRDAEMRGTTGCQVFLRNWSTELSTDFAQTRRTDTTRTAPTAHQSINGVNKWETKTVNQTLRVISGHWCLGVGSNAQNCILMCGIKAVRKAISICHEISVSRSLSWLSSVQLDWGVRT